MCVCLVLRIIYALAINWAYYYIYLVDVTNIQITVADNIDRFNDGLGPVDLVSFTFLYELIILNLNVKKGHKEFWQNLQCCTAPYL